MDRRNITLTVLLSFCLHILPGYAGRSDNAVRIFDKCPLTDVREFCNDTYGYLWVAGDRSLCRFNGYEWTVFSHDPNVGNSLPEGKILDVKSDKTGRIWCLTDNGTAAILDKNRDSFETMRLPSGNAVRLYPGRNAMFILSEEESMIQIGYEDMAMRALQEKCAKIYAARDINEILYGYHDNVIFSMDSKGNVIHRDTLAGIGTVNDMIPEKYQEVQEKKIEENCIICTDKGIWTYNIHTGQCIRPEYAKDIRLLAADIRTAGYYSSTKLFFNTVNPDEIFYVDPRDGVVSTNEQLIRILSDFDGDALHTVLNTIYSDGTGNCWLGSRNKGLYFILRDYLKFDRFNWPVRISENKSINAICPAQTGYVWLGTTNDGLIVYNNHDQKKRSYTPQNCDLFKGTNGDEVTSLLYAKDRRMWAVIGGQLCRFHVLGYRAADMEAMDGIHDVNTLFNTSDGRVIAGSKHGLYIFTDERISHFDVGDIRAVLEANDGSLILAVHGIGLKTFRNGTSGDYEVLLDENIAKNASCLAKDHRGRLYVGSDGYGFACISPGNESVAVNNTASGLSDNHVKSIISDKYSSWISTGYGLNRYNPYTGKIDRYYTSDGLTTDSFISQSSLLSRNHVAYFGGNRGLVIFDPKKTGSGQTTLDVIFEDIDLIGIDSGSDNIKRRKDKMRGILNTEGTIDLPYRFNSIEVRFTSLAFTAHERVRYQYCLEGISPQWTDLGQARVISLYNLPHGNYSLKVRSLSDTGTWTQDPASLRIHVDRHPAASVLAIMLYIMTGVAGIGLYRRYYLNKLKERNEKEIGRMKVEYYENISHELRTPLSLILSPVELLKEETLSLNKKKECIDVIAKNVEETLSIIDASLQTELDGHLDSPVIPVNTDICRLLKRTCDNFNIRAQENGVSLLIECGLADIYPVDAYKVSRIIYNLLSNALNHTPEEGTVKLCAYETEDRKHIRISVSNSGEHISDRIFDELFVRYMHNEKDKSEKGHYGIGLNYAYSLSVAMGGSLNAERLPEGGMKFILLLPADKDIKTDSELITENIPAMNADDSPYYGKTVLIADDNADLLEYMKTSLSSSFRIVTARNGREGYEKAIQIKPDMIVSDVRMPEEDGIAFLERIRSGSGTANIPFLLLTGESKRMNISAGLRKGADAYIVKPFSMDVLRASIESIFMSRERLLGGNAEYVPSGAQIGEPETLFIQKLYASMDKHLADPLFHLDSLAEEMAMSRTTFYRKMKELVPVTPNDFMKVYRLNRAARMLIDTGCSVGEAAAATGFTSAAYFSRSFKEHFGKTPKEYTKFKDKS